jgi:hypothetical protein
MAAKQAPWRKPNPKKKKKGGSRNLSPAQKVRAKRSARKAGRPYPNLVDNMLVARKSKKRKKGRGSRSEGKPEPKLLAMMASNRNDFS